MSERLSNSQIVVMRSLLTRSGGRPVALDHGWQRGMVLPLSRRGLIEVWYRQSPGEDPSLRGPYFSLSIAGARLAACFTNPAPRGFSGAEHCR